MAILFAVLIVVGVLLVGFSGDIANLICNHLPAAKKLLLYVVAVIIVLACIAFLPPAHAEVDFYPASAIVVDFSTEEGVILLEDGEGHLWQLYWDFKDEVPVELGDVFSLLMWEAGTPTHQMDDEILDATNSHIKAQ